MEEGKGKGCRTQSFSRYIEGEKGVGRIRERKKRLRDTERQIR